MNRIVGQKERSAMDVSRGSRVMSNALIFPFMQISELSQDA